LILFEKIVRNIEFKFHFFLLGITFSGLLRTRMRGCLQDGPATSPSALSSLSLLLLPLEELLSLFLFLEPFPVFLAGEGLGAEPFPSSSSLLLSMEIPAISKRDFLPEIK
jgi:hypothetical protein